MDASPWAKAPDFAGNSAQADAVRTQTVADKQNYLESGMAPIRCGACGTEVLVRKNSYKHTSIQWVSDPSSSCAEFSDAIRHGARQVSASCPRLRKTIEHAVLEGILTVPRADADD